MSTPSLNDILLTPLKKIPTLGGDVMHALKASDNGFNGFGEAYFSWIEEGAIKAWKCHKRMTLNLVVPMGEVRFVFNLPKQNTDFLVEDIGEKRFARLTVPPGIWFGFKGKSSGSSLVLNFADIIHDPDEMERKSVSAFAYEWGSE